MKSAARNIKTSKLDDLFKTDDERLADSQERIQDLPLESLVPFPNHPFKVLDDEKMQETVESIKEYGVLVPILVRPSGEADKYEIVSGHRRHHASILAGKNDVPAIIRDLDDDAAILVMVDSNLQRETILPSEKAFAYKMKLDAMKRQGKRRDLTSAQVGPKLAVELIGEESGDSKNQVKRFIRLTNLSPDLLDMVDSKAMALNSAVELSYLRAEEQTMLLEVMEEQECSPSMSQAGRLKQYSQDGKLERNVMDAILSEEKTIERKLVLKGDQIDKYFSRETTPLQKQKYILKLLDEDAKRKARQRGAER